MENKGKGIIILIIIIANAIVFSLFIINPEENNNINNFEECVAAGYPIMESYPRQCMTTDGKKFVEILEGGRDIECESLGGTWIESAKECEYISEEQCLIMNGNFNPCASACRNDPDAEFCTMQCVPVCHFKPLNLNLLEAIEKAKNSECSEKGTIGDSGFHNNNSHTWWIEFTPFEEKSGCNPACVVSEETGKSKINWRCTGLIS